MSLTANLMRSMDVGHLLAAARCELDPLTATPLEVELLDRLEALAPGVSAKGDLLEVCEDFDIDAGQLRGLLEAHCANVPKLIEMLSRLMNEGVEELAELDRIFKMLDILDEEGIDNADTMRTRLQELKDFRAAMNDAGDIFNRLAAMAATQE